MHGEQNVLDEILGTTTVTGDQVREASEVQPTVTDEDRERHRLRHAHGRPLSHTSTDAQSTKSAAGTLSVTCAGMPGNQVCSAIADFCVCTGVRRGARRLCSIRPRSFEERGSPMRKGLLITVTLGAVLIAASPGTAVATPRARATDPSDRVDRLADQSGPRVPRRRVRGVRFGVGSRRRASRAGSSASTRARTASPDRCHSATARPAATTRRGAPSLRPAGRCGCRSSSTTRCCASIRPGWSSRVACGSAGHRQASSLPPVRCSCRTGTARRSCASIPAPTGWSPASRSAIRTTSPVDRST